ncbi:MAG: glycosyltransferase family 4 protein [Patescibacteria group bacterium]|jgi:glycosyltransferase involved in cell wall biosynthesis
MKIAHVVASLPPDIGGMGRVAYDEASELVKRGHQVTVFTLAYFPYEYKDEKFPFKVVRAKPLVRSGIAGLVPELRQSFHDFDLVHLHYPFYGGAEWVWLSGRPYVVTYHMDASPTLKHRQLVKNVYDRLFAKRIMQKSKRVILVDERHYLAERKFIFPDQSIVIHNGINTEIFKPQTVNLHDLGLGGLENKKIFMFVGNLLPIKGLSKLLKAWHKFNRDDAHLAIVGGGYHEHEYRAEAENLKIKNITWLGACHDPEKMAKFYAAAFAVVIPSISESFSLVATEAMACETPVVSSNLPGMHEKIIDGETGYVFETGNEVDLEKSLKKIISVSHEEKKKMGEKGRKLVLDKFSMQGHMDRLEEVYKEAV